MMELLLAEIAKKHRQCALEMYMGDRCLEVHRDLYYCSGVLHYDTIYSGLFLISKSVDGTVNLIENRSVEGQYTKLYQSDTHIPIWQIQDIGSVSTVIVTESVLDAITLSQLQIPDITVTSLFRASYSLAQFHYLLYASFNKKVITAFDNDEAGVRATDRFKNMAVEKYNKNIFALPFPHKDINAFRCKSTSVARFKRNIIHAIKGVI